ncbi:MAG TPA: hypothetical protein PKN33_11505 [Phycisphaerae bacterium]|nr:hypothetical protein [Phycisphaerae bacterium]
MRSLHEQRVFKWLGIFACAGLLVAWAGTRYAQTYIRLGYFNLSLEHGAICTWISDHSAIPKVRFTRERCERRYWWPSIGVTKGDLGFDAPIWLVLIPVAIWTIRKCRIVRFAPERCARCREKMGIANACFCGRCKRLFGDRRLKCNVAARWMVLLLCVLLACAWWISRRNRFTYSTRHWDWTLQAGCFEVTYDATPPYDVIYRPPPLPTKTQWWPDLKFDYSKSRISLPAWMLLLPLSAATYWLSQYKPVRAMQCVHCRYDLTGNVSGVCPECGSDT